MKTPLYYLAVLIALGLNSCLPFKNKPFDEKAEQNDYLVYQIDEAPKQRQLLFYDPANNTSTQVLTDWDISLNGFSLGANDRLAFASSRDGNSNIYILDYPFNQNIPTKITFDTYTDYTPLAWSLQGHYLLLDSLQADNKKLSLWDGKSFLDIYDYQGQIHEIAWSVDERLAFTEFFINHPSPNDDYAEVYMWDGYATVSVSQNPSGEDRFPTWNKDGQLAFLGNRNGEHDIFVWDGISKNNDLPDINTFVNIAPNFTSYVSSPTWTNSGTIAFSGGDGSDLYGQVYEWDGKTAKNISQNPSLHNGGQTWRNDGYWSFITFFSSSQNLYIRDDANQTILETKGQYPPAWSPHGLLAFCTPDDSKDWILSVWNGVNVIEVARGGFIVAKWSNGEYIYCSHG